MKTSGGELNKGGPTEGGEGRGKLVGVNIFQSKKPIPEIMLEGQGRIRGEPLERTAELRG